MNFIALKVYDLYNNNCSAKSAVFKSSLLSQVAIVNKNKSDIKSTKSGIDINLKKFDYADLDLLSTLFRTKVEEKRFD